MTDIKDRMTAGVEAVHVDAHMLTEHAVRRGRAVRRRRAAAATGLAAAAVAATMGLTGWLGGVAPGPGSDPSTKVASSASAEPSPRQQGNAADARLTGRMTAAALAEAVTAEELGELSNFAGQDSYDGAGSYAEFRLTPTDGLGWSKIEVNVQPGFDAAEVYQCASFQADCSVERRPDGSILSRYEERSTVAGGTGVRRLVDLLRSDGTRVVISASNGMELPNNRWLITREQPPLSYDQLTEVVSQGFWSAELPARFESSGSALAPYQDLGGANEGGLPTDSPTPTGPAPKQQELQKRPAPKG